MTTTNRTTSQVRNKKPSPSASNISDHDRAQQVFRSLGLRYTTKVWRFCAENKISIDSLREFSPQNNLDLVMLGTPNIDPEEAEVVMDKFITAMEGTDFSYHALHAFCLEAANAVGFFMTVKDAEMLGRMIEKKEDLLMLFLPMAAREMIAIKDQSQSLETK